ncbi:MAG: hypothetical protein HQ557_07565 [Bacteroidetes bacterium]|nr:hypothetical protein [Bacteroidota bacterium]
MVHSPKKLIVFVFILVGVLFSAAAADYSTSLHVGIEPDQLSVYQVNGGLDLRILGGRGVFGAKLSADYLPTNTRNYHNTAGNMFIITGYGLIQASLFYGDMTFYAGPGTSIYIMPGIGTYSSLAEDSLFHLTFGTAFNLYPLQIFAEAEIDVSFGPLSFGIARPRIRVGAGLLR